MQPSLLVFRCILVFFCYSSYDLNCVLSKFFFLKIINFFGLVSCFYIWKIFIFLFPKVFLKEIYNFQFRSFLTKKNRIIVPVFIHKLYEQMRKPFFLFSKFSFFQKLFIFILGFRFGCFNFLLNIFFRDIFSVFFTLVFFQFLNLLQEIWIIISFF